MLVYDGRTNLRFIEVLTFYVSHQAIENPIHYTRRLNHYMGLSIFSLSIFAHTSDNYNASTDK